MALVFLVLAGWAGAASSVLVPAVLAPRLVTEAADIASTAAVHGAAQREPPAPRPPPLRLVRVVVDAIDAPGLPRSDAGQPVDRPASVASGTYVDVRPRAADRDAREHATAGRLARAGLDTHRRTGPPRSFA
jgi:hypothetical protein